MSTLSIASLLPSWFWPESRPRRWIHGMGLVVAGGTFLFWIGLTTWGFFTSDPDVPIWIRIFGLFSTLSIGGTTALFVTVPYVLGSLAASTARRPAWIAGACGVVTLLSLSFRVWAYGVAGGEQAFVLVILLTVPYSALMMTVWAADLWVSYWSSGQRVPVCTLAVVVTIAALSGLVGSVVGWMLRDSQLWMPVGGSMALASLGLGFWATRWARQR